MWILGYLSSTHALVLVNGAPIDKFLISKGVWQGDLLFLFPFILAMEGIHAALAGATNKSLFRGIKLPYSEPSISHLFYVDDTIFVGNWYYSTIQNLYRILKCFHVSSDLKVNFHMSQLFSRGIHDSEPYHMAHTLGCLKGPFSFIYLGIPIGSNMSLNKHWIPIVEKFQDRLLIWKTNTLSFGGRLTLIKSVFGSLPISYFSSLRLQMTYLTSWKN